MTGVFFGLRIASKESCAHRSSTSSPSHRGVRVRPSRTSVQPATPPLQPQNQRFRQLGEDIEPLHLKILRVPNSPLHSPSTNSLTVAKAATFWCPNGGKKLNNFIAKGPHWQSIGSRHIVSFCPSPESCAQRIASATACVRVSQVSHCVVSAESPSSPPPSPRDHARSAARQKLVATSLRAGKCAFAVPPLGNDGAR